MASEVRRYFPDLKIDVENISDMLNNEILKREVLDGNKVKDAQQRLKKAASKIMKAQQKKDSQEKKEETEPPQENE